MFTSKQRSILEVRKKATRRNAYAREGERLNLLNVLVGERSLHLCICSSVQFDWKMFA